MIMSIRLNRHVDTPKFTLNISAVTNVLRMRYRPHDEGGEPVEDSLSTFGVSYYATRLFSDLEHLDLLQKQPNLMWDQCHTRPINPTKSILVPVTEIPST